MKLFYIIYHLLLVSVFLCLSPSASAQQNLQKYYPECIPATPEAASLVKALNYPVGYNTGVPEISIPLYEIKSRGINIPITLDYHGGGFKVREVAAATGLGWNLSTNFQIVRELHGFDDFKKSGGEYAGYYYNKYGDNDASYNNNSLYTDLHQYLMANGDIDSQPDRFYYNIGSKSGSFVLSKNRGERVFLPIPYNGISITCTTSPRDLDSSVSFTITDTDGTEYNFALAERMTDLLTWNSYESSWKCTSIVSADKTEEVNFTYTDAPALYTHTEEDYTELYEDLDGAKGASWWQYGSIVFGDDAKNEAYDYYDQVMKKFFFFNLAVPRAINHCRGEDAGLAMYTVDEFSPILEYHIDYFGNNFVPFDYNATLQTRLMVASIHASNQTVSFYYDSNRCLYDMEITDSDDHILRNYYFDQSYVGTYKSREHTNLTNYLDSIRIVEKKFPKRTYTYSFEYYSKHAFANYEKGGNYWGGINSRTVDMHSNVGTSVPGFVVPTRYYTSDFNYVDSVYFQLGNQNMDYILDVEVEPAYSRMGQLRKITYPTGGYTEFRFGMNEGYLAESPFNLVTLGGLRINEICNYDSDDTLLERKVYEYGERGGGIPCGIYHYSLENMRYPFSYQQEVEYMINPRVDNNHLMSDMEGIFETRTTYMSGMLEGMNFSNGSPVYYEKVTEYDYNASGQHGKKEYLYTDPEEFGYQLHRKLDETNLLRFDESWRMGRLEHENTYRSTGDGQYILEHSVDYEYDYDIVFDAYSGTVVPYRKRILMGAYENGYEHSLAEITDPYVLDLLENNDYIRLYAYGIYTGMVRVAKKTETSYDGGNASSLVTEYSYDKYSLPVNITVTYPDGHSEQESISYARNFSAGIPFIHAMRLRNQIGIPVMTVHTKEDGTDMDGVLRIFRAENPAQVEKIYVLAPGSKDAAPSDGGMSIPSGYYRKALFEYDDQDNLVYSLSNDYPGIVYLWGYDNQYPVAEIRNSDYASVCEVLGADVVSTLKGSYDSDYIRMRIEELRTHPAMKDAQVRTFIYSPLIGVTEITEADGLKTGYSYDGFGRLTKVRGHDGFLINEYDYHYIR